MRKAMLVFAGLLLVLALLVGLGACSRGTPSGQIKDKVIKIGGCVPLTGAVAYWGISTDQAWKDGAEVINARGGVKVGNQNYKLQIIAYDSKGSTPDAQTITKRLIEQDKVKYIYNQAAASTIGMLEISEPAKVISSVACWGYLEHYGKNFPFHFRSEMSDYEQGFAYMPFVRSKYPGIKTAAFLGPDDKDGYDCYYSYQRLMKYYNVEDLGVEYFQWETTDFYPLVTKTLQKKPDMIITSPTPPGITASIVKAARELGFKGPVVSPGASETKTILEVCGEQADGVVLPVTLETPKTQVQKDLAERFKKRFGEFNLYAGNLSWWVYALAEAFEKAGTFEDTTKVAAALQDVVLKDTYVGTARYGGFGAYGIKRQGVYDCYTMMIEKQKGYLADVRFPELPPGYD
jgi:branched-chain amino acid transport system substrate-binding protein